jgi:hypothetical protein
MTEDLSPTPERSQHDVIEARRQQGVPTTYTVTTGCPIDRYHKRGELARAFKRPNGSYWRDPAENEIHHQVAKQYREMVDKAGASPRYAASQFTRIDRSNGGGWSPSPHDQKELARVDRDIGRINASVLRYVVVNDGTAHQWAEGMGFGGKKGVGISCLVIALHEAGIAMTMI